ncbi:MAG: hypothetical protein IKQ73_07480 [Oscillospiraceae bacterium]|nr:hypothetical protein [Oscillospiraceae bacterium]MCR5174621.1 hypothetical protein [Oscillospiraceae bacterium]
MTKEEKYASQLMAQGLWDEILKPAVHELCILERELTRLRKAWSATAPPGGKASFQHPLYDKILRLNAEIRAARSALFRSAKILKTVGDDSAEDETERQTPLALIRARHQKTG